MVSGSNNSYFNFEIQKIPLDIEAGCIYRGAMPWELSNPKAGEEYYSLLKRNGIQKVVVLVTQQEIDFVSEFKYPNALEFYAERQFEIIHFPILDGDIPRNDKAFENLIGSLTENLKEGQHILVHCMGGIGRTGLVISCIAKKILISNEDSFTNRNSGIDNVKISDIALKNIRDHLPGAVETKEQKEYLNHYMQFNPDQNRIVVSATKIWRPRWRTDSNGLKDGNGLEDSKGFFKDKE